ncbi:hypothetical protein Dimus_011456 [Dionaea muscipula]
MPYADKNLRSLRAGPLAEKKGSYHCNGYVVNTPMSGKAVRNLRLKWRKLNCLASQVGGSTNIFNELYGECNAQDTFWLDSSTIEKGRARFSIMGGRGGSLWKQITFKLSHSSDKTFKDGGLLSIEDAQGLTTNEYLESGFFDFLDKVLNDGALVFTFFYCIPANAKLLLQ